MKPCTIYIYPVLKTEVFTPSSIKQLSELSAEAGSNNLVHRLAGAWERRQRLLEVRKKASFRSHGLNLG